MSTSLLKTPLHGWHSSHGGRMVEFGGWSMPVQYTSIIEEHQAVRRRAGLFDISHMGRLRFEGPDALPWIEFVTTNQVDRLRPGQIQYSLIANDEGGLIDDILVYRLPQNTYWVVCNASNREAVVSRFEELRQGREARLVDETLRTSMIALQGPLALQVGAKIFSESLLLELGYYRCGTQPAYDPHVVLPLISRTGYTGEDGFEFIVESTAAETLWTAILKAGFEFQVLPCGLGARDTLRFEAGMPLYGHELGPEISPFESGVGWAVKLNKGVFAGQDAVQAAQAHPRFLRVGLELEGKRIARQGTEILDQAGQKVGKVSSGTFAPTLEKSLCMGFVEPALAQAGSLVQVEIRGRLDQATVIPLPFYKRAKA